MRRFANALRIAAAGVMLAAPAAAAPSSPDPVQLLDRAYAGPPQPYEGRVILTRWAGARSTSEEANVFFSPPSRYRLEFLSPDGAVNRVVVGDSQHQDIELVKEGKTFSVPADDAETPQQRDEERRLLLANYDVSLGGAENVTGRPTWIVDFTPKTAGKPTQRMWIDQETSAVLQMQRSLASANTGASSRFTRFEIKKTLPDKLFGTAAPAVQKIAADRKPETIQVSAAKPGDPKRLTGGFALRGADLFDVKGESVRHLRYTDGLIPVSLFVTRAPVDPKGVAQTATAASPTNLLTTPVEINQWKRGAEHYTLVGEVSPELLKQMAAPVGN